MVDSRRFATVILCSMIVSDAAFAADVVGTWDADENGAKGTLNITAVDATGKVTGTIFGNSVTGFFDKSSGKILLVRIRNASDPKANQVFTGYYMSDAVPELGFALVEHLAGSFEAFSGSGGTAARNVFGWFATRKTKRPL